MNSEPSSKINSNLLESIDFWIISSKEKYFSQTLVTLSSNSQLVIFLTLGY
jgi:hypothetical protein